MGVVARPGPPFSPPLSTERPAVTWACGQTGAQEPWERMPCRCCPPRLPGPPRVRTVPLSAPSQDPEPARVGPGRAGLRGCGLVDEPGSAPPSYKRGRWEGCQIRQVSHETQPEKVFCVGLDLKRNWPC